MLVSPLPYWVSIILCAVVLGLNIVAVLKAAIAIEIVNEVDEKVKTSVLFVKSLTADAEILLDRAKSENVKTDCKKVYEAFRYSDPMSSNALATVENEISTKFSELSNAVASDNAEEVSEIAKELVALISERNKKCKLLK